MERKRVFVTVGTTRFDTLIEEVCTDNILSILENLGYNLIHFQIGESTVKEKKHGSLTLVYESYLTNFEAIIKQSDLVISHAGAGTCLEVLKHRKPLIIVINDTLMDNHQIELAEQLEKRGYLVHCTPQTLQYTLLNKQWTEQSVYPKPNCDTFSTYLNKCMGF